MDLVVIILTVFLGDIVLILHGHPLGTVWTERELNPVLLLQSVIYVSVGEGTDYP